MPDANPAKLILPVNLALDRLPEALNGLRIAHLSDLHVRRPRRRHRLIRDQLAACEMDLLVMTGDYMHAPGHEPAALDMLADLLDVVRPRLGVFGSFGNHDTNPFIHAAADLPVHWLRDTAWTSDALPLTMLGLHYTYRDRKGDLVAALLDAQADSPGDDRLRILLAHEPTALVPAACARIDLVFAGHTHGGQIRPAGQILVNRCDWPRAHSRGIQRLGHATAVISNGLGESTADGLRHCCPPHIPLITLTPGKVDPTKRLHTVRRW